MVKRPGKKERDALKAVRRGTATQEQFVIAARVRESRTEGREDQENREFQTKLETDIAAIDERLNQLRALGSGRQQIEGDLVDLCIRLGHPRQNAIELVRARTGEVAPNYRPFRKEISTEHGKHAEAPFIVTGSDEISNLTYTTQALARAGQAEFRQRVLEAYDFQCCLTGCKTIQTLEAAHISPFSTSRDNAVSNGICLRADLHRLFDGDLLTITADYICTISPVVKDDEYRQLSGKTMRLAARTEFLPSQSRLKERAQALDLLASPRSL